MPRSAEVDKLTKTSDSVELCHQHKNVALRADLYTVDK